jgi:deoxyribonuclease IV
MTAEVRFGPAGNPIGYKGKTTEVCDFIKKLDLNAYEYQATHGVRISKKSARELRSNSSKNDVLISMHAPYYINLCSYKDKVIKDSIDRLIKSAIASEWMNSYRIVFHPGFYTKYSPKEAYKKCIESIRELILKIETLDIKKYTFSPETTGKKSQIGTLDEIVSLCQLFDNFTPTIDFAHLYARSNGSIKTKNDYEKIFEKLENDLGLKTIHCHFTKIEFNKAGELRHRILSEKDYGPPLEALINVIIEIGWDITVICESPLIDRDAIIMKAKYEEILEKKLI